MKRREEYVGFPTYVCFVSSLVGLAFLLRNLLANGRARWRKDGEPDGKTAEHTGLPENQEKGSCIKPAEPWSGHVAVLPSHQKTASFAGQQKADRKTGPPKGDMADVSSALPS